MKKSQVLSALALTYIAGSAVAPMGNIYAEAVQENCAPSSSAEMLAIISADEIDGIVARIKALPLYRAYQQVYTLRTTYTNAEATKLDTAVTDAQGAVTAATTALSDAETVVAGINLGDVASQIRRLGGAEIEVIAETKAEDILAAAHESLPLYDLYVEIVKASDSSDLQGIKDAVAQLAEQDEDLTIDADAVANATSSRDAKDAIKDDVTFKRYRSIRREEAKVEARDAAEAAKDAADKAAQAAEDTQKAVIDQIITALQALEAQEVTINTTIRPRATVAQTVRLIKNENIDQYAEWTALIDYIEGVHGSADTDQNTALHAAINTELRKVVTDESVIYDIFNPVALRKVCSADGRVAIKGQLPVHKLVIKAELLDNLTDTVFADDEQVVYDITIEYQGATYDNAKLDGSYAVTVDVPENMDGSKATVYYVNGNSRTVQTSTYDAANNTITFEATHFSHYAIVGPNNFGGYGDDAGFTNPNNPDEDFGGNDSENDGYLADEGFGGNASSEDQGFTAPIISVGTEPIVKPVDSIKLPAVETPNTGVVAQTSTDHATATSGIVAGMIAAFSAAIALVVRRMRRNA